MSNRTGYFSAPVGSGGVLTATLSYALGHEIYLVLL